MRQAVAAAFMLAASAVPASAADRAFEGKALFDLLKHGGYVIYLRHAVSDLSQADRGPITVGDCSTQRNLSEQGRVQAQAVGAALKTLGISIGSVTSSPYCRAEDTARLAFGSVQPVAALYNSFNLPKETASKAAAELKQALSRAPTAGKNTVIVGHVTNIRDVAGIWPKTEGGGIVIEPLGTDFRIVGSFSAAELINAAK